MAPPSSSSSVGSFGRPSPRRRPGPTILIGRAGIANVCCIAVHDDCVLLACGGSVVRPVTLTELFVQAGGPGSLGGQVIFQLQDPLRGGQGVALVEQLPNPGGEGQLAPAVAAASSRGPLRPH